MLRHNAGQILIRMWLYNVKCDVFVQRLEQLLPNATRNGNKWEAKWENIVEWHWNCCNVEEARKRLARTLHMLRSYMSLFVTRVELYGWYFESGRENGFLCTPTLVVSYSVLYYEEMTTISKCSVVDTCSSYGSIRICEWLRVTRGQSGPQTGPVRARGGSRQPRAVPLHHHTQDLWAHVWPWVLTYTTKLLVTTSIPMTEDWPIWEQVASAQALLRVAAMHCAPFPLLGSSFSSPPNNWLLGGGPNKAVLLYVTDTLQTFPWPRHIISPHRIPIFRACPFQIILRWFLNWQWQVRNRWQDS